MARDIGDDAGREEARARRVLELVNAPFLAGIKALPRWDRATPLTKSIYATHVLRSQGSTHYLVLRLGRPRVEVGARGAGGLKAHCRRELRRLLTIALGRPVEFWFTLEGHSLSQSRPKITDHLNIIMVIDEHEMRIVRDVLIDFSAYHYRQKALTISNVWNGFWLSFYNTKEYVEIQARLGVNQFAITQELGRRAKALYEADLHDIRAAQALRGLQLAA